MTDKILQRWLPHDFAYSSSFDHENPFAVTFGATLVSPSSGAYTFDGFYDGDSVWKLRFAPWEEGVWSIRTKSDDLMLDGHELTFVCVVESENSAHNSVGAANVPIGTLHGGLLVDYDHPNHFIREDDERYFLMGYECDWLWALDLTPDGTGPDGIPTIERLLDRLTEHGFNHLLLNTYAHDCGWQSGSTGSDDYGPPPLYAWGGTNDDPDHARFNLAFWQHYDRVIDALMQRDIVAHVMIKVYNKMVNWPEPGSDLDDRFFRWIVARYAAYPNIVWDFAKESNNEPSLDYKLNRVALIRKHDPYRRLITTHDDEAAYMAGDYDGVLDFHSDQHHQDWHAETLRKRSLNRWPIVNVELGYEHGPNGPDDKTYGVAQSPEEQVRRAWEVCMAGGYSVYYYTYTAWDVIRPDDDPPGYAYFGHLSRFFRNTNWWRMSPADERVRISDDGKFTECGDAAFCLADCVVAEHPVAARNAVVDRAEYIVFMNRPAPIIVSLEGESFTASWFDPLSGERWDAGACSGGEQRFDPFDDAASSHDDGATPIVLHLVATSGASTVR
jgi:hypothetical protein